MVDDIDCDMSHPVRVFDHTWVWFDKPEYLQNIEEVALNMFSC